MCIGAKVIYAFELLLVVLVLKLLWNILTPLVVLRAYKRRKANGGQEAMSLSLAPTVELGLVLAIALMAWIGVDGWQVGPSLTLLYGVLSVVVSYGMTTLVGFIVRRIANI